MISQTLQNCAPRTLQLPWSNWVGWTCKCEAIGLWLPFERVVVICFLLRFVLGSILLIIIAPLFTIFIYAASYITKYGLWSAFSPPLPFLPASPFSPPLLLCQVRLGVRWVPERYRAQLMATGQTLMLFLSSLFLPSLLLSSPVYPYIHCPYFVSARHYSWCLTSPQSRDSGSVYLCLSVYLCPTKNLLIDTKHFVLAPHLCYPYYIFINLSLALPSVTKMAALKDFLKADDIQKALDAVKGEQTFSLLKSKTNLLKIT